LSYLRDKGLYTHCFMVKD